MVVRPHEKDLLPALNYNPYKFKVHELMQVNANFLKS